MPWSKGRLFEALLILSLLVLTAIGIGYEIMGFLTLGTLIQSKLL